MRTFLLGLLMLMPWWGQAQVVVTGRFADERQQPVPYASIALADGSTSNEVKFGANQEAALSPGILAR